MSKLENKIDASDRSVSDVLKDKKYTVDYFQREYSWEQKHIVKWGNFFGQQFRKL